MKQEMLKQDIAALMANELGKLYHSYNIELWEIRIPKTIHSDLLGEDKTFEIWNQTDEVLWGDRTRLYSMDLDNAIREGLMYDMK